MSKVLIIGSGPAGVSAALYARRGGAEVTVLSKGLVLSGLHKAEKIENYYGLAEPVSGAELYARGIEGARKIGVEFVEDELLSLMFNDSFTYTELGLLDNTHIHFWGIGDFLAEAKEIGLEAETVDATQLATGTTEQRIPYDMMDKELLNVLLKRQYGTVYQWIITLKRSV
jgi:glycine/D-amino acid oxidase-like deaminating enzyme